jgi:hypothetical protein
MPAGVDLSKAKAWINQNSSGTTPGIGGSLNIKSVTRNGTGDYTVVFATPFKSDAAAAGAGAGSKIPYVGVVTGYLYGLTIMLVSNLSTTRHQANITTEHDDSTLYNSAWGAVFFGELENE